MKVEWSWFMSPLTWQSSCVRFEKHRSYFHACCATFSCSHETPCCCHWCPWLCCLIQFGSVVCAPKIYETLPRVLMARGNNDRLGELLCCPSRIDRQWMTASVIDGRISPPAGAIVWSEKNKEHGETSRWRGVALSNLVVSVRKSTPDHTTSSSMT